MYSFANTVNHAYFVLLLFVVSQILSRAFHNRFIELHYDDIPVGELVTILQKKCQLPLSYAKKMIAIMKELQV